MSLSRPLSGALLRLARTRALSRPLSTRPLASPPYLSICRPPLRPSTASSNVHLSSTLLSRSFFSASNSQARDQQTEQPSSSDSTSSPSSSTSSAEPSQPATSPDSASSTPSPDAAPASASAPPPPPPPPPPSEPSPELAEKNAQLAALEAKYKETYDRLLRTAADLENVRRTSRIDVDNARKYAATAFAKSMLEVADTLELAAKSAREALQQPTPSTPTDSPTPPATGDSAADTRVSAVLQSLLEGIEMTEKVLAKALAEHGIVKMDVMGQKFNPHEHHALFEMEDEGKEPGSIAHVMKAGYRINDRILRAAQVGTVKKR